MTVSKQRLCPECNEPTEVLPALDRRNFIRVLGGAAATLATGAGVVPHLSAADEAVKGKVAEKAAKPAESLVLELVSTLSDEQKKTVILPWDHGNKNNPTRLGMYNAPLLNQKIADVYTKPQVELVNRILRATLNGDDGYDRISRKGTWDNTKAFENCGSHIFGDPTEGKHFAWLFTGHHITLRCDSDLKDGIAWGGPLYYGHSAQGYSPNNVYNYQTKRALEVFNALDAKQQAKAIVVEKGKEGAESIKFKKPEEAKPGIAAKELSKDQQALVQAVMRDILSPYRKEDADEVMATLKANGGLEKLHLAYYKDKDAEEGTRWSFWRLEGPGFVWNYRVLDHVHCFVNIAKA